MSNPDRLPLHPRDSLLIGALDDELTAAETATLASHLAVCAECFERYQSLGHLSSSIESAIAVPDIQFSPADRSHLEGQLVSGERRSATASPRLLRPLSYAAAVAAAITLTLLVIPEWKRVVAPHHTPASVASNSFEVDGETFVALPWSNPDLPLNSSHIVRMQVPVSSLAQAGVVFEPISNEISAQDRSVLADVLLGIDGQPLGVHVLAAVDNSAADTGAAEN